MGNTDNIGNPTVNRFQVRVTSAYDPKLKRGRRAIVRTALHELGHGLGLRHPWDPQNDVADVDQKSKDNKYDVADGVKNSTVKKNIMNSDGNKNENLKPISDNSMESTAGQRKKLTEVIPEK